MVKQVPFINREQELKQAQDLIEDWDTQRVLCFHASGGVGKTRLMQEIRNRALLAFPEHLERQPQIILLQEFTDSDWSRLFLAGVHEVAGALNVQLLERDAEFDERKMADDLQWAVSQEPDVILIRLGTYERLQPEIQRAVQKGISIIAFDNYLRGFTARIALDYSEEGRRLAKRLIEDIQGQGKVALAWDPDSSVQKRRYDIFESVAVRYPEIELVHYPTGFMGEQMAETVFEQTKQIVTRHPDLKAIWVTWDELTKGVVTALLELGRNDVSVYSFDLCRDDVPLMAREDSPWVATVATNPKDVGRTVVHIAAQAAVGGPVERRYDLPMTLITQDELSQALRDPPTSPLPFEALPFWSRVQFDPISTGVGFPLHVAQIIDFDNRTMRIAHNLWMRIADMLNDPAFDVYRQRVAALRKQVGISDFGRSAHELNAVNRAFIDAFNTVSAEKRIVLFMDTTDSLYPEQDVWSSMLYIVPQLENCAFFIGGRNARSVGIALEQAGARHVVIHPLPLLSLEASRAYLKQKQAMLQLRMDPVLAENLVRMADGKPILIDLAVEWRSREIPLDWLVEADPEQLVAQKEAYRQEFERQLVQHIAKTQRPIDWLLLVLAHIYPVNEAFLRRLLVESPSDTRELFEQAKEYVFVKLLPDGRISLHDEMRRMMNEYVWPQVDPEGVLRRRYSEVAAEYLEQEAERLDEQIDQLELTFDLQEKTPAIQQRLTELERRFWSVQTDRVRYALDSSWTKGIHDFQQVFDKAPLDVRDILLELVESHREEARRRGMYHGEMRYAYEIRLVKQYLRKLRLGEALDLMQVLEEEYEEPSYQIDILSRFANYNMQRGHYWEAAEQLEQALEIIRDQGDPEMRQWEGRLLNTLGMVNRRMGRLDKASEHYQQARAAYQEAEVGDRNQLASILNNIGYIQSLQGKYESALRYCEHALRIRQQLDVNQAVGASYATLGEVHRNWGHYVTAIDYYNEALRIFEPQEDRTWLARLYSYRGAVYRLLDRLDLAEADLEHSISFNVQTEKPWQYHVLGCVVWNKGDLDQALDLFQESMELAQEVHDIRTQVNNLVGVAEVSYAIGLEEGLSDAIYARVLEQAEKLEALSEEGYDFPHHYGRMQRVLADVIFDRGEYERALEIYARAYALLGRRLGGYGKRTFTDELNMLARRIERLAEEDAQRAMEWCHKLRTLWSDPTIPIQQRDALIAMCDVHETNILWNLS